MKNKEMQEKLEELEAKVAEQDETISLLKQQIGKALIASGSVHIRNVPREYSPPALLFE